MTVAGGSPGYLVLGNYGLAPVACDPSAPQAVLYGPDGSVVCAIPAAMVPAGYYAVDPASLALVPTAAQ